MKYRDIAIVSLCIGFSIMCLAWAALWMMMAKDLSEKVDILEQEIIEYKWQLEQVNHIVYIGE